LVRWLRPRERVAELWSSMCRATPGVNGYQRWRAYGASKAALLHLSRIWDEELRSEAVRVLSIDPGDMDTPLHAAAVPDADRSSLKRPEMAARELAHTVAAVLSRRASDFDSDSEAIAQEVIG
jgi:NAD(P)-dependent dehydrogenase (short-subunit alcohol dehydrogenase family)